MEIKKMGFTGFKSVKELSNDYSCIENVKGIYMVLYLHTVLSIPRVKSEEWS